MTAQENTVARIREIADKVEAGSQIAAVIAWTENDGLLRAMTIGHQLYIDALATHVMRVQVQHGAYPAPDKERTQ